MFFFLFCFKFCEDVGENWQDYLFKRKWANSFWFGKWVLEYSVSSIKLWVMLVKKYADFHELVISVFVACRTSCLKYSLGPFASFSKFSSYVTVLRPCTWICPNTGLLSHQKNWEISQVLFFITYAYNNQYKKSFFFNK